MRIREHRGFGHGLAPGMDSDLGCTSCRAERAAGTQPTIGVSVMPDTGWLEPQLRERVSALKGRPTSTPVPLMRAYAELVGTRGTNATLKDVHDAWMNYTRQVRPDHPDLVPFEELPPEVAAQDQPYLTAIRKLAAEQP